MGSSPSTANRADSLTISSTTSLSDDLARSRISDSSGFVSSTDIRTTMPPPKLLHRPSSLIRSVVQEKRNRQLKQEEGILASIPNMSKIFTGFEDCKKMLLGNDSKDPLQFEAVHHRLKRCVVEAFDNNVQHEARTVMGNRLARIRFVPALVDFYKFVIEEYDIEGVTNFFIVEGKDQDDPGYDIIVKTREILWNFSDSSFDFGEEISRTGLFKYLLKDLTLIYQDGLDNMGPDIFALSSAVGILHNCARNPDIDREEFRRYRAIEVLKPYLECSSSSSSSSSRDIYVKMITLLALANIVDEKKLSQLVADTDVLNFLLDCIRNAMSTKDRMEHGFHVEELVDGLVALSQSNQSMEIIFDKKPLPLIKTLLKGTSIREMEAALNLTNALAFSPEIKDAMLMDAELMKRIKELKTHSDPGIESVANSAYFDLVDSDNRLSKSHDGGSDDVPAIGGIAGPSTRQEDKGKHIMISYSWGDKETVLQIYQKLFEARHNIWIDVREMKSYANVLSAMAVAVENASVVLMCFSEKYKRSRNCRREAEYADKLNKDIIFLKMERGYQPDGWLGILIGAQLYIEFSPHYPFEQKMKELRERLEPGDAPAPVVPFARPSVASASTSSILNNWTKQDIDKWMKENHLEGSKYNKIKDLTGRNLGFMKKLMFKSPDTFYSLAREQLALKQIEELMRFDDAMGALP